MEKNIKISKILRKIYNLDYSNVTLRDNDELIIHSSGYSEFNSFFKKFDLTEGIIVSPVNYKSGLFFSIANGGELYASSRCSPAITKFAFDIAGLKKGYFYRLTVTARDTDNYNVITEDRTITVSDNENNLILESDLNGFDTNQILYGYFRANSNEASLYFSIGKIVIKDIVIEEILLDEEENLNHEDEEEASEYIPENKEVLVAYAAYDLKPNVSLSYTGKYKSLNRLFGKGLSLVYNSETKEYVLERSNIENVLETSFTNIPYRIELDFNKTVNDSIFDRYAITEISNEISPTTIKQGYLKFVLLKNNQRICYPIENSKLYIFIYKLQ